MKNKVPKGSYGYIDYQRKIELIKSICLFVLTFAIFAVGFITTKTRSNLLSIVAVLSVLPAAKSLATTIVYLRHRSGNREVYEEIHSHVKNLTIIYDLVITSYHKSMQMMAVTVKENTIVAFTEQSDMDVNQTTKFVKEILEKNGYKNLTLKVFTDKKAYLDRLDALNEKLTTNDKKALEKEEKIKNTIMAISI